MLLTWLDNMLSQVLTQRLIGARGVSSTLKAVTDVFEEIYQGTSTTPGLCARERLITPRGLLEEVKRRCPKGMAVVTGRPRKDCDKFLTTHGCVISIFLTWRYSSVDTFRCLSYQLQYSGPLFGVRLYGGWPTQA